MTATSHNFPTKHESMLRSIPRFPALAHHLTYRTPRRLRPGFAQHAASAAAHQDVDQRLQSICRQYGIETAVNVHHGPWGLGLFKQQSTSELPATTQHNEQPALGTPRNNEPVHNNEQDHDTPKQQAQQQNEHVLVSVPLQLVLSCSIPGSSPHPGQTSQTLQGLLQQPVVRQHWELQIAVLLLWALRQPAESGLGGFWRQYAAAFLPTLSQQQTSLLLWSKQELVELQDTELQGKALDWQQTVQQVFRAAVQPAFSQMARLGELHCSSSSSSVYQGCTLDEWLWAVAAVESRAFGVLGVSQDSTGADDTAAVAARVDPVSHQSITSSSSSNIQHPGHNRSACAGLGASTARRQQIGLVPVLDLANHTCRSNCRHAVDSTAGTFNLFQTSSGDSACSSSSNGCSRPRNHPAQEVLITYGEKDNRQLMEQYGFCVPGNPFNRVHFAQQQQQQLWMSHGAVKQAAMQVKQEQRGRLTTAADVPLNEAYVNASVASIIAAAGWKNLGQYKLVTPSSTARRTQQLLGEVHEQLEAFATSVTEDELLLQQLQQHLRASALQSSKQMLAGLVSPAGAADATSATAAGTRLMTALQYRIDQKRLLVAAARVLRAVL